MFVELLEIIEKSIPGFNPEEPQHLIKADKIIKAESKLNSAITVRDSERLFSFFKISGSKYAELLNDKGVRAVLKCDLTNFNRRPSKYHMEVTEEDFLFFSDFFSEDIYLFIYTCIRSDSWFTLRDFIRFYPGLLSLSNIEKLKKNISDKNNIIVNSIPSFSSCKQLNENTGWIGNAEYYRLQSDIDALFFDSQILAINNSVARNQENQLLKKACLGKLLKIIGNFEAYDEDLKRILKKNAAIGESWIIAEKQAEEEAESEDNAEVISTAIGVGIGLFMIFYVGFKLGLYLYAFLFAIVPIFLVIKAVRHFNKRKAP